MGSLNVPFRVASLNICFILNLNKVDNNDIKIKNSNRNNHGGYYSRTSDDDNNDNVFYNKKKDE